MYSPQRGSKTPTPGLVWVFFMGHLPYKKELAALRELPALKQTNFMLSATPG
jgi:hypothetical protein